ncbi:MAG: hypothetical protein COV45_04480 [Deltaproteobacteria bacterium CG11_big_fil_rev_8_21_14_0_20_47_16]|nr:MAG: hypothetical protein COV45_04480 [Deltaproteobacteria bacterium CG11_big_fil_rev_8_21_14_0_20_47_16]
MKQIYPLGLIIVAVVATACTRYSYPSSSAMPALSAQANLSSSTSPNSLKSSSSAKIVDVACVGSDYQLRVSYQQDFDKVIQQDLQYQVFPESSEEIRQVTHPTGTVPIETVAPKGEVTFVIPATKFQESQSDIVLRLRIKSQQIIEATSPYDIIHVSHGCN